MNDRYKMLIVLCLFELVVLVLTIDIFLIGGGLFGMLALTCTIIPILEAARDIYLLAIED